MTIKTELLKSYICDYISSNICDFEIDENKVSDTTAIKLLEEIQKILQNEEDSDFYKVEKIVCLFEENKINAGSCHDF